MANIERIKTDVSKEIDGVWVDFVLGIRLKIARARNSKYREVLRDLMEPVQKDVRNDTITLDALDSILIKARAKTILLDWENIETPGGDSIPYSSAQAEKFFSDPELKDFYEFVVTVSESADDFKKEFIDESVKN